MNGYVSIKKFAEYAGISQQAVYQRLDTTLKQYVKVVKGHKKLNIQALKDIYGVDVENVEQEEQQGFQQDNQANIISILQEQLVQKDKEINRLYDLLDQQQKLHALDKQRLIELEAPTENPPVESQQTNAKKGFWKSIFG